MKRRRGLVPTDIVEVQRQVQRWRKTRGRRGRVPEDIWQAAVGLARSYGVSRTARDLGLGYVSLKGRVGDAGSAADDAGVANVGFVEVSPATVFGTTPAHGETVVELHGRGGGKVVIRLPVGVEVDVARVAAAVCGDSQ